MDEVLSEDERERVEAVVGARVDSAEIVWGRAHVVRVGLSGGGGTAIVKRPRRAATGPGSAGVDDLRTLFLAERAGLEFLAAMPASPAPTLLGVDDTADLLVMDDLPSGTSGDDLLLGDDPDAAADAVVELARTLARIHGWSVGRESDYQAIRARVGLAVAEAHRWTDAAVGGLDGFAAAARAVGVKVTAAFEQECGDLVAGLGATGWWRGFVHGDPCPDNALVTAGGLRLLDYEHANYASVLLDASYVVAPFPTCWCFGRLPEAVSARAVAAYRADLARFVPEVGDDAAWTGALLAALASWIVARGPVIARTIESDRVWGTTTMRPRLLEWIDSFLALSASGPTLPATRSVFADLRQALTATWPNTPVIGYPAFG
jgi:hypothetical protein